MGQDYVKGGGTSTAAQDQRSAMERAEAEKRRSYQDNVQNIVRADPDHARLYTRKLGGISDNASVVLKVEHKDRSTKGYLICDLLAEEHDGEPHWMLLVPCPVCYYDRGEPITNCTMTLRSWHRRFSLDPQYQGTLWVSPLDNKEGEQPEACTLAGSIHTHETQTCPKCAYRFEIGPARLDANEAPVSGAIRPA